MPEVVAVRGDITTQEVDAVVNAANNRMRGGGGVDGAIHRAGGPDVLEDCKVRFPRGLATGDAGWTTAGRMPARWVIHTVGPNHTAGQTDRGLLVSCYRRSLEVADELGARSVAFPLISAGVYGWPKPDAIAAAVDTVASTDTDVEHVRIVVLDEHTHAQVEGRIARWTPMRILQGVRVLHQRGFESVRVLPGMSGSGIHWRAVISAADNGPELRYTTGSGSEVASGRVDIRSSPGEVADLLAASLESLALAQDPAYVAWYAELLALVERDNALPIAYADYFEDDEGWEVGWGSGTRHPHPPPRP